MPENFDTTVQASALRAGDTLLDGHIVESIDAKQKWTTINFVTTAPLGQKKRVENETQFTVTRQRATAEEQAEQRMRYTLTRMDDDEADARKRLATARLKMIELMQTDDSFRMFETAATIVKLQTIVAIWDKIALVHVNNVADVVRGGAIWQEDFIESLEDGEPAYMTRVDVLRKVKETMTSELVRWGRFDSRSTSVVSNTEEDLQRQAKCDWMDSLEYSLGIM